MSNKKAKQARRDAAAKRNQLRAGLPPLPEIMSRLDIDERGYPIPWFTYRDENGVPDFRIAKKGAALHAAKYRKCFITGQPIRSGVLAYGPISVLTQVTPEPFSDPQAMAFAVQACPFLAIPSARRNHTNLPEEAETNPNNMGHNPGLLCVHEARSITPEQDQYGHIVFRFNDQGTRHWIREGKEIGAEEAADPAGVVVTALRAAAETISETYDAIAVERRLNEVLAQIDRAAQSAKQRREARESGRGDDRAISAISMAMLAGAMMPTGRGPR